MAIEAESTASRTGTPATSAAELAALLVGGQRVGEGVQPALEHRVEVVLRELDAVVGDAALAEVVGADLLRAVARADLRAAVGGELGRLLGHRALVEAR